MARQGVGALYEHWRVKGQFEERNPYCDACGKMSAGYAIISGA